MTKYIAAAAYIYCNWEKQKWDMCDGLGKGWVTRQYKITCHLGLSPSRFVLTVLFFDLLVEDVELEA